MSLTFSTQSDTLLTSPTTTEEKMMTNNAYYMFMINMGIVLFTAWALNLYAIYVDENKKKNKRTKNVLD